MKRILCMLVALLLLCPYAAQADGTLTVGNTLKNEAVPGVASTASKSVTVSWVANGSDASIGAKTINMTTQGIEGWWLYDVAIAIGTTTTTADMTIGDAFTTDLSNGGLANFGTLTGNRFCFGTAPWGYQKVKGNLTLTITNNAQNGATGSATFTFLPQ
jgi:hypothetical protein